MKEERPASILKDIFIIFDPDGRRDSDNDLAVFNSEITKAKMRMVHRHSRSVVENVRKKVEFDMAPNGEQKAALIALNQARQQQKLNGERQQSKLSKSLNPSPVKMFRHKRGKQKSEKFVSERKKLMIALIIEN